MISRLARVLAALAVACVVRWPAVASAATDRFAVLIGNNEGAPDEAQLRYAERDIEKIDEILRELGGFEARNIAVLRGADADTVVRTLADVNDRVRRSRSKGNEALLLVYYSGHASADALHLGGTELKVALLNDLVTGSPATVRILVSDACRSGALTRVKGGRVGPAVAVELDDGLAGEGAVLLTSSAAGEDAQESDALGGSFFTHYFASGLLGSADMDGDGAVALEEAYRYARDATIRASSRTLAGTQHPTYRYDLKGRGSVVLTRLGESKRRGKLELPTGHQFLVLADHTDGAVVAEVAVHDKARSLWLAPGRYGLVGRASDHLPEGRGRVEA